MNKDRLIILFLLAAVVAGIASSLYWEVPRFAAGSPARQLEVLDIREVRSPGGITAWLVEDRSLPVISMQFAFLGAGSLNDPERLQGRARMVANTLDEGAGGLDSHAFRQRLEDRAIALSFGAQRDDFTGSLKTLTRHRKEAFDLLRAALSEPRFDPAPVERMRQANMARIRNSLSDPDWVAARLRNDVVFGDHPYALNSGGTLSSLERITPEDLRDFAETGLARGNLVVGVSGDISADELAPVLDRVFGELPAAAELRAPGAAPRRNAGETILFPRDIPQTIFSIVQDGIDRLDPDYDIALVMNHILGAGGFGSRLMTEIREKRGLTYGIYSYFSDLEYSDTLNVTFSTRNETAAEALEALKAEWQRLREEPVPEAELESAKSYLAGSLPLSFSSTDAIAGMLTAMQQYGLPIDTLDTYESRIEAVSAEDILRVARERLTPDALTVIMVGRPEGITPDETRTDLPNVR